MKKEKVLIRSIYSFEDWERANFLIKEAFFAYSDYQMKDNIKLIIKNREIIGALSFRILEDKTLELNHFNIEKSLRGRGLGETSVRYIKKYFEHKGFEKIIFVSEKPLKDFYLKQGFSLYEENDDFCYFLYKLAPKRKLLKRKKL